MHPLDVKCPVCLHPERKAIDAQVLGGGNISEIANSHSLTPRSVKRHRDECIPQLVSATVTYRTVSQGLDTLQSAENIVLEAQRLGKLAETEKKDYRTALVGLREQARGIELVARLTGELDSPDGPLTDARWLRARDAIIEALRPYPEAARAVSAALVKLAKPQPPAAALPSPAPDPGEDPRT